MKRADVIAWLNARVTLDEDSRCLIWKLAVNSAKVPVASVDGMRGCNVRRWLHEQLVGPAEGMRVVAKCRHPLCVAPEHYSLLLPGQVAELAAVEGRYVTPARLAAVRRNGRLVSNLTPAVAQHARAMRAEGKKLHEIAAATGMSIQVASKLCRGESWQTTAPAASVFSWGGAA